MPDNVVMPDLDPVPVIDAVVRDPRLRVFTGHGKIETMPARQARRRLLLDAIAQAFEPGVRYPEQSVNLFLGEIYADYAALRRYLVDEDFLSRSEGQYWRSGGTVLPPSGPPSSGPASSRIPSSGARPADPVGPMSHDASERPLRAERGLRPSSDR